MNEGVRRFITYYIRAFLLSVIVSGVGVFVVAGLLYKGIVDADSIKTAIAIVYFLGGLCGGVIAGKFAQSKRFLWGIAYGILFFMIILIVASILNGDDSTNVNFISLIICAIGGMVGGMLG